MREGQDQPRVLGVVDTPEEWGRRYDLPIRADQCPRCGCVRTANIPFASGGFRGLMSELHECGEEYRLRVFRPIGEELKKWEIKGRRD